MPVGALALITAGIALPSQSQRRQHKIDYAGAATLIAGAVPLLLAFSWAGDEYAWLSAPIIGLLAFSLVMFSAFILVENRAPEPIIKPAYFRNSIFGVSVIATFLLSAGMFGAIVYLPLFVQGVIGTTATGAGQVLTPMMLAFIASSMVGGQILSRTGKYKILAIVSFGLTALGMFLLSQMPATADEGLVIRNMIVTGLGIGVVMSLFTIVVQNAFPFSDLGQVTASLQFFRSIGATIGTAILGSVMTNNFQTAFLANLPPALKAIPPDKLAVLDNPQVLLSPEAMTKIQQSFAAFSPQGQSMFNELMAVIRASLGGAITSIFAVSAAAMLVGLISVFCLREVPLRTSHSQAADSEEADGFSETV